jgi:rhodanese-related sulfurtransferase
VSPELDRRLVRWVGAAALVLAVLAPLAGSPYASRHASIDVASLARTVVREEDHVTALELAQWIKERRPGLRIVDVRSAEEYAAYHVPRAEHITLDSLAAGPFRRDETIVLYSEGGAHAAQAWVFLRALGYAKVFFLRGGLYEWLDQVMNPRPADTTAAARTAFDKAAVISRYFGGVPRSDERPSKVEAIRLPVSDSLNRSTTVPLPARSTETKLLEARRRGC